MKFVTDAEKGWIDYSGSGRGQSPTIRHHWSGQIDLLSPGDHNDKASLHNPEEKLFVLYILKRVYEGKLEKPFQEKMDDIIVTGSEHGGYDIRNRRVPNTHFHFISESSLKFVIDTLLYISEQPD